MSCLCILSHLIFYFLFLCPPRLYAVCQMNAGDVNFTQSWANDADGSGEMLEKLEVYVSVWCERVLCLLKS